MPALPTPSDVRAFPVKFDWVAAGYPIPAAQGDPDSLQKVLEWSAAYIASVSGQPVGDPTRDYLPPWWSDGAIPPGFGALVEQAIAMRMVQVIAQTAPDYLETLADFDLVQSFSAGSYSESRRDPTRRGEGKSLNEWPLLNDLIWQIMTPDRYAYWQAYLTGVNAPAFAIQEVDWSGMGYDDMESIMATRYELESPWYPY